uniref:Uncharacterized protein n=1 Tax=Panagrolaimus davidi TaxID=227884 RepID=A0A914PDE1_9BILA
MPSSEENVVITNESKKSGLSTKWKKVKQLFGGKTKELSQDIQNGSSPEISTFSASTKLLQQRRPTSAARGIPFVNAYRRCTRPANERYNPRLTKGQTMKYQPKAAVVGILY